MTLFVAHPDTATATLHGRFEHQVLLWPHNIAVSYADKHLTYEQLDRYATEYAKQLIEHGVDANSAVAIMLPRGIDLIVYIMAVLKVGAYYVPIDPNHPIGRVEWVLQTSNPVCVISRKTLCDRLWPDQLPDTLVGRIYLADPDYTVGHRVLTSAAADKDGVNTSIPHIPATKHSAAAYVIFTSGSTGKPKGVMVGHSQVINLLDATQPLLHNDHTDVWTLFHSFAFDFSVWEIWGALTTGARLCIVSKETTWSAEAFCRLLRDEHVSILNQTPSSFYALINAECQARDSGEHALSLRSIILGGEALNLQKLEQWWQYYPEGQPRLINMYGITETTVHVTWLELTQNLGDSEHSPIGQALLGLEVHLLDPHLHTVAEGQMGEIFVSGVQLAQGYLNRPDLSASRFIASPFHSGQRMYRSGDLALRRDGQLFYLGRADRQLNIRGFRVEPAEIESTIESHPAIRQCAVLVKPKQAGQESDSLIAFLLTRGDDKAAPSLSDVRAYSSKRLPAHLLPGAFFFVSAFPLNVNGKLDQDALLRQWQATQPAQDILKRRLELLRSKMVKSNDAVSIKRSNVKE